MDAHMKHDLEQALVFGLELLVVETLKIMPPAKGGMYGYGDGELRRNQCL